MLVQSNEFWAWWSSDGDIKKVESKNRKKTFNFLFNPRKKNEKNLNHSLEFNYKKEKTSLEVYYQIPWRKSLKMLFN